MFGHFKMYLISIVVQSKYIWRYNKDVSKSYLSFTKVK